MKHTGGLDANVIPECPGCGSADGVEVSILPEIWDGYCYNCRAPFKLSASEELVFQVGERHALKLGEHSDGKMAALIAVRAMPKRFDRIEKAVHDPDVTPPETVTLALAELRELAERIERRLSDA